MSGRSYMETLLDGIDVEWKPLGEVLVRTKGTKITAGQMKELHKEDAPIKIFAGGKTVAFVEFADLPAKDINQEASIIVKSRGIIEFEYYEKPFSHKNEMWSYHSINGCILIKYVYYFLKLSEPHFQKIGGRMQMPQISTPDTDKFLIPLPPLNVQKEIVRILDTFTELTTQLTTELTTELTNRKKQYNHYRDQLLSFENGDVEWRPLGEVGEFIRGKRFTKSDYVEHGVGAIHYGEIYTHYGTWATETISHVRSELEPTLRFAHTGDVVMAGVGETVEDVGKAVAWLGAGKVAIHDDSYAFRHSMNAKYLAYYMQTGKFIREKEKHVSCGKMKRLLVSGVSKVGIPIPFPTSPEKSISEQARIVAILDKFETFAHSISEGLPREIELRQKQYAYYRDLLLSFPKPKVVA